MSRGSTAERVEVIAGMMRRVKWVRGRSAGELAKKWGLSEKHVRELSAEASRVVRAELSTAEREDAATLSLLALEKMVADSLDAAEQCEESGHAVPHRRVAIEALRDLRALTGANAPARAEVNVTSDMPTEKLEAMLAEAVAVLQRGPR